MTPLEELKLNRRQFIGRLVLFTAGLLLGPSTVPLLNGCGYYSKWKGISFPKLLLTNFKLFDGMNNRLDEGQMILIQEGVIKDLGRVMDPAASGQYRVVDLNGNTLMPGLIDNHVHITVPQMSKLTFATFRQM